MTKTFQQLWEGEKPSEDMLTFTDKLIHELEISIGMTKTVEGHSYLIRDVGDIVMMKMYEPSVQLAQSLIAHNVLPSAEEIKTIIRRTKMLILYWYAQKWLPSLKDFKDLPTLKERSESESFALEMKKILEGGKPPVDITSFMDSYMEITQTMSGFSGRGGFSFMHGAGNISQPMSPAAKTDKFVRGAAAKLAKDVWGLEEAETDEECNRIYRECTGLMMYWTMKGWVTVPSPN